MTVATKLRRMQCTPESVFDVLGDGWLYCTWVVGASRMREVDDEWPAPQSRLHHSVGLWPFVIDDTTTVEVWQPPTRMVLTARGWPIGEALVTIDVQPDGEGSIVRMVEEPITGPVDMIPRWGIDPLLRLRNREVLRRLAFLAEGKSRP